MSTSPSQAGAVMPPMMYGCAWKKERTADLVYEAIKAGFRGVDTAAMRKHYDEKGTGDGIRRAIDEGIVKRSDLYIQTKFTPGDPAYSDTAHFPTIASQVHASIASSLSNLGVPDEPAYVDSVVMHSPYETLDDTLAAWTALETFVPARIRRLGISHATVEVLTKLLSTAARHPPAVVQNRFCARECHFHADVRRLCAARCVAFQAFWTLTGNPKESREAGYVRKVAEGAGVSPEAAWYSLIVGAGMVVLNGTTNAERMRQDLKALERVETWKREDAKAWKEALGAFEDRVGKAT